MSTPLTSITRAAAGPVTAISNIAGAANGLKNILTPQEQSFWQQLQPASFGGFPFAVTSGHAQFGRRNAVHEYPFRDTPWVEDLGRQARTFSVTGFIVGDDVMAQRDAFIRAVELPGTTSLVHPTFGRREVSVIDFSTTERWDAGRVFELSFTFIETGQRQFPGQAVNSAGAIADAVDEVQKSSMQIWADKLRAEAAQQVGIAADIGAKAQEWGARAFQAVNSATALMNIAASLQGNFGRLIGQNSGIPIDGLLSGKTSLQQLIGLAAGVRATVSGMVTALNASSSGITGDRLAAFATQASVLATTVRAASFTPADAIRSMTTLADLSPSGTVVGAATSDLFRLLAITELANASAAYQPSTTEEAVAVRGQVLAAIDAEMTIAGNQGDDGVYTAMRGLRAEVIRDMNAKGAQLPMLVLVTTLGPVPSLVLAQRLYRDPSRSAELERRSDSPHPAFLATSFKASSS